MLCGITVGASEGMRMKELLQIHLKAGAAATAHVRAIAPCFLAGRG